MTQLMLWSLGIIGKKEDTYWCCLFIYWWKK